jgi:hypothetical protein
MSVNGYITNIGFETYRNNNDNSNSYQEVTVVNGVPLPVVRTVFIQTANSILSSQKLPAPTISYGQLMTIRVSNYVKNVMYDGVVGGAFGGSNVKTITFTGDDQWVDLVSYNGNQWLLAGFGGATISNLAPS